MNTDNPQHRVFIQSYLRSGNKRAAYKAAYPDIQDGDSLRVASNRLFRQLKPLIEAVEMRATELAMTEIMNETVARIKNEICSMEQRRIVLADIIMGRTKVTRHIKLKDCIVEVEEDVNPNAVIRAIDLDSRLAANRYKEKGVEYTGKTETPVPQLQPQAYLPPLNPDDLLPLEKRLEKYPYGHEYWNGKLIRLHGIDVEKYGFDVLEYGVPYLKGVLTEAYKEIRFQKDVADFKQHYPEEARKLFGDKKPERYLDIPQERLEKETKGNNELVPVASTEAAATDLWAEYLKLDSNTRALHWKDRKQKETWFRAIPLKQQLKLIALYKKTG